MLLRGIGKLVLLVSYVTAAGLWLHFDVVPRDGPIGLGFILMAPIFVAIGLVFPAPFAIWLPLVPAIMSVPIEDDYDHVPLWLGMLWIAVPYGMVLVGAGAALRRSRPKT